MENTNKAIIFSMGFSLFAKLFNFSQSLVVSYAFGTNKSTDILFYLLSLIILLTTLLSSINQQIIIPNTIEIRKKASEEDSRKFIMYMYMIYLAVGIVVTAVLAVSPETILDTFSKLGLSDIRENILIVRFLIPAFLLIIINTYILDIFTSYKYFTMPMMLDMFKNVVIIAFVLILRDRLAVTSLAIGVLAGNFLQFIVLNYLLFHVLKCRFSFKKYALSAEIKRNIAFVITGQLTTFLNGFAVMYLMSGFSAGVYSAMDYSVKINTVFSMVVIGQIVTVVGINIIELHAGGKFEKLNETFISYFKSSMFFILPFSFLISLNSEYIISILFERGRFGSEAAALTGAFLKYFSLTPPYVLLNSFIVRLIIAKQIQRVAFFWQASQSVFNVAVIGLAIHFLGYMGYPVGSLAANYIYVLLLVHFLLKRQFGYIDRAEILRYFLLNALLNILIYWLMTAFTGYLPDGQGILYKLGILAAFSLAFLSIYLASGYITGLNRGVMLQLFNKVKGR